MTMILQNFRAAAMGLGRYCPKKNELRVCRGRRTYRFTCGEQEIRIAATGQPEVVIPLAPDATVEEFKQSIAVLIAGK
jgi:hypothetical protein